MGNQRTSLKGKKENRTLGNRDAASPHSSEKKTSSNARGQDKLMEKQTSKSSHQKGQAAARNSAGKKNGLNHSGGTKAKKKRGGSALSSQSLLDASIGGDTVCREVACEGLATSAGYCRLHYIKNWKKIKQKAIILSEGKLNQYIEELVAKYPDKYIEAIRQDLAKDKDFAKVIYDLDLDEGVEDFEVDGAETVDNIIDTLKRDFEDEGDPGF